MSDPTSDGIDYAALAKQAGGTLATPAAPAAGAEQPSPYAKSGSYTTQLPPSEEGKFQGWVKANKIPWQDGPTSDYDMRGYWKAQQGGDANAHTAINPDDHKPHYPDTWKTPFHRSFSNESMYATPGAPHWEGNNLVSSQQDDPSASDGIDYAALAKQAGGELAPPKTAWETAKDVVAGPNTMLGQKLPEGVRQEGQGISDIFHGDVREGLSKFAHAQFHIIPGSPAEKLIQKFDPTFKGAATSDQSAFQQIADAPMVDAAGQINKAEHPMMKAIAENLQSFTSPGNIAIMAETGGLGMIKSARALAMAGKLVSAGFALPMVTGAYKHLEAFKEAYDSGNENEAVYQLTHAVTSGAMGYLASKHAAGEEVPVVSAFDNKVGGVVKDAATQLRDRIKSSTDYAQKYADEMHDTSPPTKAKALSFKDTLAGAGPQMVHIMKEHPDVSTPEQMIDHIDEHIQNVDKNLKDMAKQTADNPKAVMGGVEQRMRQGLDEAFANKPGQYKPAEQEAAVQSVMDHLLQEEKVEGGEPGQMTTREPSLAEMEGIRKRFSDDSSSVFGPNAPAVPPAEKFAKAEAAKISRNEIDQKFEDLGYSNVKEYRLQEKHLIDQRDQLKKAVEKSDERAGYNWKREAVKALGWAALEAFFPVPVVGLAMGATGAFGHMRALKDFAAWRSDNPNLSIAKAADAAQHLPDTAALPQANPNIVDTLHPVNGPQGPAPIPQPVPVPPAPTPPVTPVPTSGTSAPVSGTPVTPPAGDVTPNDNVTSLLDTLRNGKSAVPVNPTGGAAESTPLQSPRGTANDRPQVAYKPSEKVQTMSAPTKDLGRDFNEDSAKHEYDKAKEILRNPDATDQDKAVPQMRADEYVQARTSKELKIPKKIMPSTMKSPQQLRGHEAAHTVVGDAVGLKPVEVRSHLHPEVKSTGAAAITKFDYSDWTRPDGTVHPEKAADFLDKILTTYMAGGAYEQLAHGVPMGENTAMLGDLSEINDMLVNKWGMTPEEASAKIDEHANKALAILDQPGTLSAIGKHVDVREPGLKDELQMSPEKTQKLIQAVKARNTNGTANAGITDGRGANPGQYSTDSAAAEEGRGAPAVVAAGGPEARSGLGVAPTEQDFHEAAQKSGAIFRGLQKGVNEPGFFYPDVALFQDPVSGTSIGVKANEWSPEQFDKQIADARSRMSGNKSVPETVPPSGPAASSATLLNNGSGESAASQEAINRVQREKAAGIKRYRVTASGVEVPLFGVDAVDARPGPAEHIIQKGPNGTEIISSGARARSLTPRDMQARSATSEKEERPVREEPNVPQEQSTGLPDVDKAIKEGGGIPGGTSAGDEEFPAVHLFHDPTTGSTLGLEEGTVTPERVKAELEKSREAFRAGEERRKLKEGIELGNPEARYVKLPPTRENIQDTVDEIDKIVKSIPEDEESPFTVCTVAARHVVDKFGGEVRGYYHEDNPTAELGESEGGHDFAIVGKFLVDPWGAGYYGTPAILDLKKDAVQISKLYGESKNWTKLPENDALEDRTSRLKPSDPEARSAVSSKTPVSDAILEKNEVSEDPSKSGYIFPQGEHIALRANQEHDAMIAEATGEDQVPNKRSSLIEDEGVVRVRARSARGSGNAELSFSVPSKGVTQEQVQQVRKAVAKQGRYGDVIIETGKGKATPVKEFALPSDVEPMLRSIGVLPKKEKPAEKPFFNYRAEAGQNALSGK